MLSISSIDVQAKRVSFIQCIFHFFVRNERYTEPILSFSKLNVLAHKWTSNGIIFIVMFVYVRFSILIGFLWHILYVLCTFKPCLIIVYYIYIWKKYIFTFFSLLYFFLSLLLFHFRNQNKFSVFRSISVGLNSTSVIKHKAKFIQIKEKIDRRRACEFSYV